MIEPALDNIRQTFLLQSLFTSENTNVTENQSMRQVTEGTFTSWIGPDTHFYQVIPG